MQVTINAGGTGTWANFHAALDPGGVPATPQGTLEVFESSPKDGSDINTVTVPITFGRALLDPYRGFAQYTVASGDTLSAIALASAGLFLGTGGSIANVWTTGNSQLRLAQSAARGTVER